MTGPVVVDPVEIVAILTSDRVTPPRRTDPGAAVALRGAMARFAGPDVHGARRRAVDDVIRTLPATEMRTLACRATVDRLGPATVDALPVVRAAPVAALLAALDLVPLDERDDADHVIADVDALAEVIGRGGPVNDRADAAAERLLALVAAHPGDPVAVVSVLYQCLDATAAMIATRLHARALSSDGATSVAVEPVPPVPVTVRAVLDELQLGEHRFAPGAVVTLAIGSAGLDFGAGPHACPGRQLALLIVDAVIEAVEAHHAIDVRRVVVDDAGRPTSLPVSSLRR